jgi:hypothetical protein
MHVTPAKIVRPDAKGRITLGNLAAGVSSFVVTQEDDRIVLIPYTEIPAKEKWLFDNKTALQQVKQGLQESIAGKVHNLGSFKKYSGKEQD